MITKENWSTLDQWAPAELDLFSTMVWIEYSWKFGKLSGKKFDAKTLATVLSTVNDEWIKVRQKQYHTTLERNAKDRAKKKRPPRTTPMT